ncbi:MAG: DUF3810 family protein [Candidatus Eremiobacteraeota bacterium]|nr:DUF3810 family protein [Candidatus Eremiobacteraeota bacterium]
MRAFAFDAVAIIVAVALAMLRPPAEWVERHYTNGVYPALDRAARAVTDLVPFALGDALLVIVLLALVLWWFRTLQHRTGRGRRLVGLVTGTAAAVALVYLWFYGLWGLNYHRVPVAHKVIVQAGAVDQAHVDAFGNRVARMLSANVAGAHAEEGAQADIFASLDSTFDAAIKRLGDTDPISRPRVKPTIFNFMLGYTGDAGFMDPWTHEVNLYSKQFFFERPATFAHEWAHVAGFADEAEANYVAVLTCINSSHPLARYSGWLLVWFNLGRDVHVTERVKPQVVRDILAIERRLRMQINPTVARAQAAAYDRYLRANRVTHGIQSYRDFVQWMAGATYDAHGLPLVR